VYRPRPPWRAVIGAALLSFAAWPAAAAVVEGLTAARVAVADRTPGELARGTRAALAEVLVKLTGDRAMPRGAAAAGLLDRASRLMLQYGYLNAPEGGLLLAVEFDEPALKEALDARGVPIWGKERPETLVFVLVDAAGGREHASGDAPGRWGEAVQAAAARRGVPVLLPMMDIEETSRLAAADADEVVLGAALELAARYATPATLVARLREAAPGEWQGSFRLAVDGAEQGWQGSAALPETLLEQAVDGLADQLAAHYADPQVLARAETLEFAVSGVDSAAAYARVMRYLGGLDVLSQLSVVALEGDRVMLRVEARGGRAGLAQTIGFGRVLAPIVGQPDAFRLLE